MEIPTSEISIIETTSVSFTIVIPFRNEEAHLLNLVNSLNALKFPKDRFEIIFINDESNDSSIHIINKTIEPSINYTILENVLRTNSPKKDAITLAISKAKGTWIVTTDADCEVPKTWLIEYTKAIKTFDAKMLCAPVSINDSKGLLSKYQQADILSLQGVTMGSFGTGNPLLCNGANLAFEKKAFQLVNGYEGNSHLASGDDVFMLQKMKAKFPDRVHFLKSNDAIVITQPVTSWSALINQRIRWASKTAKVKHKSSLMLGLLVFMVNFLWIIILILGILAISTWYNAAVFIFLKIVVDALFIKKMKLWMGIQLSFLHILLSGFIYPFITCFVTIKSQFFNYQWKGRLY
ncbi:glycosyltransferase family 2 protein [Patiriisocius marinus]|uniref:Glycosyl transferase n=1 Tax=Patiriisocius marinus TaxID=1397112 RepID=A0A5J4J3G7_9FLAO|nr:glycosyltransferase [Patiriisocius marinus]GER60423.1 glycosyl transferase [Patiriisocius marinus]